MSIRSFCTTTACCNSGTLAWETIGTTFQNSPTVDKGSVKYSDLPLEMTPLVTTDSCDQSLKTSSHTARSSACMDTEFSLATRSHASFCSGENSATTMGSSVA